MSNRLQRWGERALGQVQSVAPRVSSRFEPEPGASTFEDQEGFREVEVETPARTPPAPAAPWNPPQIITHPPPQPEPLDERPEPLRISARAIPPPATIDLPTPSSQRPEPVKPYERVSEPASRREEETQQPRPSKTSPEERPQPLRPVPSRAPEVSEPSLVRLKRFQDWMAAPPREQPGGAEALEPPVSGPMPFPGARRASLSASPPIRLPSTRRDEPTPAPPPPPPPVVVNIGTIIVRANPAAAPKPVAPPPAASLATFLARRTAGEP
jgi:hypothetical protein